MKTFAAGLAAAYASGGTTLCACLRVLRTDDVLALFTSRDVDVVVGGETYVASTGLDITNLVSQAGLAVANMEIQVLPDDTSYPQADILAGRWDNAKFWLFECDYSDPTIATGIFSASRTDINLHQRGTAGESDTLRSTNKFELRGLKQAFQQPIGAVTSKTCRARLGDELCRVDLALFTNEYPTTAVASRHEFTCAAATEDDDYYGEGTCTGLTGPNTGFAQKIKTFAAGVFTLALPMPYTIGVGDEFRVVAGCRKRHSRTLDNPSGVSDCLDKFDNVLNFQGEPHLTGTDLLTADPDVGGA